MINIRIVVRLFEGVVIFFLFSQFMLMQRRLFQVVCLIIVAEAWGIFDDLVSDLHLIKLSMVSSGWLDILFSVNDWIRVQLRDRKLLLVCGLWYREMMRHIKRLMMLEASGRHTRLLWSSKDFLLRWIFWVSVVSIEAVSKVLILFWNLCLDWRLCFKHKVFSFRYHF